MNFRSGRFENVWCACAEWSESRERDGHFVTQLEETKQIATERVSPFRELGGATLHRDPLLCCSRVHLGIKDPKKRGTFGMERERAVVFRIWWGGWGRSQRQGGEMNDDLERKTSLGGKSLLGRGTGAAAGNECAREEGRYKQVRIDKKEKPCEWETVLRPIGCVHFSPIVSENYSTRFADGEN